MMPYRRLRLVQVIMPWLGWDNGINGALKYSFFKHLVENFKEK